MAKNKGQKSEAKDEAPADQAPQAEHVEKKESAMHVLLEDLANELKSIKPGNREVDLAAVDAFKALEKVSSCVAFIEKALSEKKK